MEEFALIIEWITENYPKAGKAIADGESVESVILEIMKMQRDLIHRAEIQPSRDYEMSGGWRR